MKKNDKGWRAVALWLAAAVLVAAAALWAFWPRPLVVEVATVTQGRFEQVLREDGRLRALRRDVLAAPVAGELVRPTVLVGDAVAAGQVVVELRPLAPQLIDARTRRMLQERVGSAEAAALAAKAQLAQAQAAAARAQLEADRTERLAEARFVSPSARDEAALALATQQRAVEAARAQVDQAGHALAEARAALQLASGGERVPALWPVRAPVAGRVVKLHHDSAVQVQPGTPLVEIADTSRLEAVVDVLSSDALRVKPGAAVRLELGPALPDVPAVVARIEPVAFTKVSALGIEEQRVNLVIEPRAPLPPAAGEGFRVEARVTIESHDGVLVAPGGALVRDGAAWAVYVVEDGRARLRGVDLAGRNADLAWLRSGVDAGAQLVLYPGASFADGQRLRVKGGSNRDGSKEGT